MIDLSRDVHSLTDFKLHTAKFVSRLKENGRPMVLTIDGKAEIIVQDAGSYERLLDLAERLETREAVREGIASMGRGEGRSSEAVFEELEGELGGAAEDRG